MSARPRSIAAAGMSKQSALASFCAIVSPPAARTAAIPSAPADQAPRSPPPPAPGPQR